MKKWYKKEILKMLKTIKDEEYLKGLYILIKNHMKKEA